MNGAFLAVRGGDFILQGGSATVDQLVSTYGSIGRVILNNGMISAKRVAIDNGAPFVVGDGVQPAILQLEGGNSTFANGLIISSNAVLRGYGDIVNNVTNYGTIIADRPGAKLSFWAYLDNHGVITATNGGGFFQLTGISRTNDSAQITMEGIRGLTFTLRVQRQSSRRRLDNSPAVRSGHKQPHLYDRFQCNCANAFLSRPRAIVEGFA